MEAGFEVAACDALDRVVEFVDESPMVLVFDPSVDGWLGSIARLTEAHPTLAPLLVAELGGPDAFLSALSAGVVGFCPPDVSEDALVRTVESMLDSGVAIPRRFVPPLVEVVRRGPGRMIRTAAGSIEVTEREWEILQLLVQRRSTREMAEHLYVSVGTVRSHVSTLLRKLGAVDRDDAVAMLEREGR